MTPQDLVCARCWRDFFNTESFELCCTRDKLWSGHQYGTVEAVARVSEIRDADCNWCAYISKFIHVSWSTEAKVTVSLSPSSIDVCTPEGANIFYLSISCHSLSGDWIGGAALNLHAWTTSDTPASEYVTARPLRTDVDSEAAKVQLRAWFKECLGHERCNALHQDSMLPTRIIEVNPAGRDTPRILTPTNLRGTYATLSYCWGEKPFLTLTQSNHGSLTEELDLLTLPPTFRDAISIARSLSIPYLWIDALCILQDSEKDKIRELARMKDVYASSILTIVAASATSVSEGMLYPRLYSETCHTIPFRIRPGLFGTMSVNELDVASYDERLEPLAKRAWTMQEQFLAQRTVTFTTRTMMWRCLSATKNFGDSLYFPYDLDAGYNDNDDKYSLNLHSLHLSEGEACLQRDKALSCWLRLVTVYSLRAASLECDKLNAVAGIASHPSFLDSLGPRYFAGLWQYNLARQFTWRTSNRHRTLPENSCTIYRPVTYRAPSWSWASIEGGVVEFNFSFDDEDEIAPEIICEIKDCNTVPKFLDLNPLGEVISGQLKIKTAARRAWFGPSTSNLFLLSASNSTDSREKTLNHEGLVTFDEASTRHINDFRRRYPDVDLDDEPEATHGTDHRNIYGAYDETGNLEPMIIVCVAITVDREVDNGVEGLLLLPSDNKSESNVFRRVGFFSRGKANDFQKETETEILII